jgi:hypothetical protein
MRSAPAAHHWTDSFRDLRWAPRHCSTSSHGAGGHAPRRRRSREHHDWRAMPPCGSFASDMIVRIQRGMSASPRARTSFQLMPAARSWRIQPWRIQPWRIQPSQLRGSRHSRASACLPALSQSPYPNFLSHAQESFVTQFCASASVAKPGTSISGRSGNLTMTSHPDPIFMGRGSNLILATDLANGGLRARCPWISGNAQQHVYPMGKMRPGLRLPQSSWHSEAEGFSAQRRSRLSSRSSRKYRVTAKSASRIARTIQILTWRIKLARHVREFNQPTRKPVVADSNSAEATCATRTDGLRRSDYRADPYRALMGQRQQDGGPISAPGA